MLHKLLKEHVTPERLSLYHAVCRLIDNQAKIIELLNQDTEATSVASVSRVTSTDLSGLDALPYSKQLKDNGFDSVIQLQTALSNGLQPMPGLGETRLKHIRKALNQ